MASGTGDGGDAGVLLQVVWVGVAFSLFTECAQKPGSVGGAGAWASVLGKSGFPPQVRLRRQRRSMVSSSVAP